MRSRRLSIVAIVAAACVVALLTVQSAQAQTYKVLHNFFAAKGRLPYGGVIQDAQGNLYGTTFGGGTSNCNCGTVFKLGNTGKFTVLYNFTGRADGAHPFGGVTLDAEGNIYGTTYMDGGHSGGMVFKLDATGKFTVPHRFGEPGDGSQPRAGVIQDAEGNLYGTTQFGGANGEGTVFKLSKTGKETILYSF
jgi:uncharacterized repeat protein (TIGR03803 family)